MTTDQDLIFRQSEGNAWYQRNSQALDNTEKRDPALLLLQQIATEKLASIRTICDVGCANGWRLSRLRDSVLEANRFCGFDASEDAISAGREKYAGLELATGLADAPPFDDQFDLVIVSFVLHWISRSRLAYSMAAIDRLVAPGGFLLIADFLPDRPCARHYHHRQDVELYTYKQNYIAPFTALGLYRETARITFSHDDKGLSIGPAADQDRAVCALLHKPHDMYPRA